MRKGREPTTEADLAGRSGLVEGTRVVLRPRLEDLLVGVTPESFRECGGLDWGADLGREQID